MAIQMRRGDYPDLVKSQLVDGELAVVLSGDPGPDDGRAMYVCFGSTTKRVATWEDAAQIIAETIGDALDITIASGDSALLVSSSESGGETAYSIAHRSRFDRDAQGLDPGSSSGGGYDVMGVSILDYGDGFYVPCVSCDRYGHVTGIEYRRLVLPSSFPIATLANAGAVMPDGSTIKITQSGVISVPMASSTRSGLLSAAMYSAIAWMDETGMPVVSSYIVGSTAYDDEWLSESEGGEPLMPYEDHIYVIVSSGEHQNEMYRWDGNQYQPLSRTPDLATTTSAGIVQPDGTSIDVTDGVISIGTIPSSALPSYVDDVLEYPTPNDFPATGESGKIYVATTTNETYRWSGTSYVSISNPLDYATQAEAEAGVENTHVMTPLRVSQAIDPVRGAVADLAADMPSVATTSEAGIVRPDGTTITVDADGTIHGASTYELPTMSSTTKGGAILGRGLEVTDGVLSVSTEGDGAIRSVTAEGWATQDGTPTPSSPVPIQVARGRNLIDAGGFVQGGINGTTGELGMGSANRIRTDMLAVSPNTQYTLTFASGYRAELYEYDANGGYNGKTVEWRQSGYVITTQATTAYIAALMSLSDSSNLTPSAAVAARPQLESGSTATPYVPYGHVGLEVRGRNLLHSTTDVEISSAGLNRKYTASTNTLAVTGTATATNTDILLTLDAPIEVPEGASLVMSLHGTVNVGAPNNPTCFVRTTDGGYPEYHVYANTKSCVYTNIGGKTIGSLMYRFNPNAGAVNINAHIQLELGSTATEYVPYHDTTIPIPLPSKGFAASLPDGTHDTLTIDGAGHVEWESATGVCGISDFSWLLGGSNVFYLSESNLPNLRDGNTGIAVYCESYKAIESVSSVSTMLSRADKTIAVCSTTNKRIYVKDTSYSTTAEFNAAATNSEILYPLASPTTEDCGYVEDWPITVEGDTVSIPELEDVAVVRWADTVATEVARQWYRRTQAVESRVAALESAVAELVANG